MMISKTLASPFAGRVALAALGLGVTLLAGCASVSAPEQPLTVGVVEVDRILPKVSEYREASDKYESERAKLFSGLSPKASAAEVKQFMTAAKQREIEQSVEKWETFKIKFQDDTINKIRTSAATVAKDKKISLVLVSSPWRPLSQRMAVDITTDVLLDMQTSGRAAR